MLIGPGWACKGETDIMMVNGLSHNTSMGAQGLCELSGCKGSVFTLALHAKRIGVGIEAISFSFQVEGYGANHVRFD